MGQVGHAPLVLLDCEDSVFADGCRQVLLVLALGPVRGLEQGLEVPALVEDRLGCSPEAVGELQARVRQQNLSKHRSGEDVVRSLVIGELSIEGRGGE